MKATVVGLGKIGLPLAVQLALAGHDVCGVDIDRSVVTAISEGKEPFPGEPGLQERMRRAQDQGRFKAACSLSECGWDAEVFVVAVPLYVDSSGIPDFRALDAATTAIGQHAQAGSLVVFETTLPVGTTRQRLGPILEHHSGLRVSKDLFLAYSPERVSSGRIFEDLSSYPKLVGGVDRGSSERAMNFYASGLKFNERADLSRPNGVWDLGSAEAAELAKLVETTYRDVNIGLANQFALFAQRSDIDIYRVIEACNSQPYSHVHSPGLSVGGHCIPVYPHLYLMNDPGASIVEAARALNRSMPGEALRLLIRHFGDLTGVRVVVLGVAYRAGVKESAFSGAFDLARAIHEVGGTPLCHDPLFSDDEIRAMGLEPFARGEKAQGVILHTAHPEYQGWGVQDVKGAQCVVDGRNFLSDGQWEPVPVWVLGKPQ